MLVVWIRVSSKQTNKNLVSNRNKPKQDLFRLCFGLFHETKNKKLRFVSVCFDVSNLYWNNRNKNNCFETNQNNPKFSAKISKYALFQTVWVGLLFVSVQLKHQNSLIWYWSETTETNGTKPKKLVKLFRLVFCLFQFNQNIDTLCFGIEAKQPKQTFCFR